MGRKGWWQELVSDEYEKTQTYYGDFRALDKQKNSKVPDEYKRLCLQEKCPRCRKTYWIDKGCYYCKLIDRPPRTESPVGSYTIRRKIS